MEFVAGFFGLLKSDMRYIFTFFCLFLIAAAGAAQGKVAIDEKTGRAVGAREMPPEELKSKIDAKTNVLIIDVRDAGEFEKETIKGAINIPLAQLEGRLQNIPKDTTLVFT